MSMRFVCLFICFFLIPLPFSPNPLRISYVNNQGHLKRDFFFFLSNMYAHLFLFLVLLHTLRPWTQTGMKIVTAYILGLFVILGKMHWAFHRWVWCYYSLVPHNAISLNQGRTAHKTVVCHFASMWSRLDHQGLCKYTLWCSASTK